MKLQNCVLTVNTVLAGAVAFDKPSEEWQLPFQAGTIPTSIYRFYCLANYFSLFKAPPFLSDEKHTIFSYLSAMVQGIKENLEESEVLTEEIESLDKQIYSPFKKERGEEWDPKAGPKQKKAFKHLIIELYGCFDLLAEIIGIFSNGEIPSVQVGRAQFSAIYSVLENPPKKLPKIVNPRQDFFESLLKKFRPLFCGGNAEKDWYKLFRLIRHKLAHLGTSIFNLLLFHDETGRFYSFLPNHWPYLPLEYVNMREPDALTTGAPPLKPFLESHLMHQDIVSYSKDLRKRTFQILEIGFEELCCAYRLFEKLPFHQQALVELNNNREKYEFKFFV